MYIRTTDVVKIHKIKSRFTDCNTGSPSSFHLNVSPLTTPSRFVYFHSRRMPLLNGSRRLVRYLLFVPLTLGIRAIALHLSCEVQHSLAAFLVCGCARVDRWDSKLATEFWVVVLFATFAQELTRCSATDSVVSSAIIAPNKSEHQRKNERDHTDRNHLYQFHSSLLLPSFDGFHYHFTTKLCNCLFL